MRAHTDVFLAPLAGVLLFLSACDSPSQNLTEEEAEAMVDRVTAADPIDPSIETVGQREEVVSGGVPTFDTVAYCRKVSEVGGGSYSVEKTCRDMEADARSELSARNIPSRIYDYCKQVAEVGGGGSYSTMNTCVDMESKSASEL